MGGKGTAYEEDIVVPLLIRGPNIQAGAALDGYVSGNIDIAPTIVVARGRGAAVVCGWPLTRSVVERSAPRSIRLASRLSHRVLWRGRRESANSSWPPIIVLILCLSRLT